LRNVGPIPRVDRIDLHVSPYRRNSQTAITMKPARNIAATITAIPSGVVLCMAETVDGKP